MKLYWYDWWNSIVDNGYYNEEKLGVHIPRLFRGEPINIYDYKDETFKVARINDPEFYKAVEEYSLSFIEESYRDIVEIKKLLNIPLLEEDIWDLEDDDE